MLAWRRACHATQVRGVTNIGSRSTARAPDKSGFHSVRGSLLPQVPLVPTCVGTASGMSSGTDATLADKRPVPPACGSLQQLRRTEPTFQLQHSTAAPRLQR